MISFIAACWPILALAYVFVVLLILGVFRLGADCDDQLANRDGPHVPSSFPLFHATTYDSEAQQDHA